MKLFRFLFALIRDNRANFFSDLFEGEDEEMYDPLGKERSAYSDYIFGKLGSRTPYTSNPDLQIKQPEIEKQVESTILGRLQNLPSYGAGKEKVEAAKQQALKREEEETANIKTEEENMYNRLGLASSTPWLTRVGEIGDESAMRRGDIGSQYDMYGMNYDLQADQLADSIARGWTGAGTTLGSLQRSGQQFGIEAGLQDLARMTDEELAWQQAVGSFLGQNQPYYRQYNPSFGENLMASGMQLLPTILSVYGGGGGIIP